MAPILRLSWRVLGILVAATIVPLMFAAPAAAEPQIQVRTIYYDASRAGEFVNTVHQAAQVWNNNVSNVRLVSGTPASITVYVDNGWPRAYVTRLGVGRFYMGRQAVNQGYYQPRIAAHEFGHILGLPDRRTGLCTDLMSGSSAPVSCRNPNPNTTEANTVNNNFRSAAVAASPPAREFVWVG